MKKTLAVSILIFTISLAGCVFIGGSFKQLNVTWHVISEDVRSLTYDSEGGLGVSEKYYGHIPGGSKSFIHVEADVNKDTSGEFQFVISTQNPHEQIANNILQIDPKTAEKGSISISSQGLEKVVNYEIFPAGIISGNVLYPTRPQGFNFATGNKESGVKHDMWMFANNNIVYAKVGATIDKKPDTFWDDFAEANNLHEYEYEEMSFEPDFGKVYLIKCEKGYAAVMFETSGWGFIYKYSETGIFD